MRKKNTVFAGLAALGFLLTAGAAQAADFVGFDLDGNRVCSSFPEMGQTWPSSEIDSVKSIDVFMEGLPNLYSYGCTFCVRHKSKVQFVNWTYTSPTGWTDSPIANSVDHSLSISPEITSENPDYKCWLIQATDFAFTTPITTFPNLMGTFQFRITGAPDTAIDWIIDGPNSGWLSVGFVSGDFGGAGETCDDGTSRSDASSWGAVKKMFR